MSAKSLLERYSVEHDRHLRRALIHVAMRMARGNDKVAAQGLGLSQSQLKQAARNAGFSETDWQRLKAEAEALIDPNAPPHFHACLVCGKRTKDPRPRQG